MYICIHIIIHVYTHVHIKTTSGDGARPERAPGFSRPGGALNKTINNHTDNNNNNNNNNKHTHNSMYY